MKHYTLALALLLHCGTVLSQNGSITLNLKRATFSEFVKAIEKQSNYRFYYKSSWVDSLTVTVNVVNDPIELILNTVLDGTEIKYSIFGNNVFITKERSILTELPQDFFIEQSTAQNNNNFDYSDYEREARKRKTEESKIHRIGNPNASPTGNATLAGTIRDSKTSEPLIGATIFIEQSMKGVSTDQFGYYSITLSKGKHELRVKSIGMKSTVRNIILYSDGKLNIELDQDVTPLKEIVVESQHEMRINNLQMGTEKLDIQTMKNIPLALGETDVMKVMLTLPGVQSVGEGTVGINVRGGATNQNLILLNDAVVYNPSHLFGFFSTFNPDILKNVELYKSGISAKYGGRLSSVLDVHTREGNLKKIEGSGGISPITGRLSFEGPIVKEKTSFIIGGRSTYSNWILRQLDDPALQKSKATFYDITAGITHRQDEKNIFYLNGYFSSDRFNLSNDTVYRYSDRNASVKWKKILNNSLVGLLTGSFSDYGFSMSSDNNRVNAFDLRFNITQATLKADVSYFKGAHTIEGGLISTRYWLTPGHIMPVGPESKIIDESVQQENGLESALFISDNVDISRDLSFYVGLRYSFYQYLGGRNIYQYANGQPRTTDNIVDTLSYDKGEIVKAYGGFEPRVGLRYAVTENVAVKLSYNRMRQYIQMLSNTTAITPTDIWKLSDPYITPQIADQVSLGLYKNFTGRHLIETSVETYIKKFHDVTEYKNGAVLIMNHHLETDILAAKGEAYGVEFLIKKSAGKMNGWVSYTYSRSLLRTVGTYSGETVNKGAYYPSNFDKPHAVNFIGNYKFSRRFNFSLNFIYNSGRPITFPVAKYENNGVMKVVYSDRNAHRIPDYIRTDVSINIEGNHKIKKLAHSSWTVAVYNLLGRANAYSVYFVSEGGDIKGYKLSVFAEAIPTITYNFKF